MDDIFYVFADVARLGQGGGVSDGKGYVQHPSQGLSQQGFAGSGGTNQQNVALCQLNVVVTAVGFKPLVVVIDRH